MAKIKILLIEDNRLLREGITAMFNDHGDFEVVARSENGDAVRQLNRLFPNTRYYRVCKNRGIWIHFKNAPLKNWIKTIRKVAIGAKVLTPVLTQSLFTQIVEFALKSGKELSGDKIK